MDVRLMLEREEGRRHQAYPDPLTRGSPWTIGVGHIGPEVHSGLVWTDEEIDAALDADIDSARSKCISCLPWFGTLNEPRQAVLIGMAFQMGIGGLLHFPKMLAAARDEHFANAAQEMRTSLWARQTPSRANRMAHQMEVGEWA